MIRTRTTTKTTDGTDLFTARSCHRAVVLLLAIGLTACTKKRYHWRDVPYCKAAEGDPRGQFTGALRVLTKHADGGGIGSLHGMSPDRDVETSSEMLVAVVACASSDLLQQDLKAVLSKFDAASVPAICNGQRLVVAPTRVTAKDTDTAGFNGALPFPTVPSAELKCSGGSVALGSSK